MALPAFLPPLFPCLGVGLGGKKHHLKNEILLIPHKVIIVIMSVFFAKNKNDYK